MIFIVFFVVLLISVSAHTDKVIDAKNGYIAPFLTLDYEKETLSLEELNSFTHTSASATCKGCTNRCRLTVNAFS